MAGSAWRTSSATLIRLALDWRTIPTPSGVLPLEAQGAAVVLGAQLHAGQVLELHQLAVGARDRQLLEASGVLSSPRERTENSRVFDSIRPAGISTFRLRIAASTSCTVRPRAASSGTREPDPHRDSAARPKIGRRSHAGQALQPLLDQPVGDVGELQQVVVVPGQRQPEEGWASASCLAMTGSSTSSGSRSRTRDTLSRTSCAATSTSRSRVNSRVMLLCCSALELVRVRSPATVESSSSRMSVTAGLDHLRVGPGQDRGDRDDRGIHVRVLPDRQVDVADDPEEDQGQAQHAGEHRAAD